MPSNLYGVDYNYDLNNLNDLPVRIRKLHEAKIKSNLGVVVPEVSIENFYTPLTLLMFVIF